MRMRGFPRNSAWEGRHRGDFHLPATLVAGVPGFFVRGAWCSKRAFGTASGKANGYLDASGSLRPEVQAQAGAKHPARAFAIAIPFSLVAALVFAGVLGPSPDLAVALERALLF